MHHRGLHIDIHKESVENGRCLVELVQSTESRLTALYTNASQLCIAMYESTCIHAFGLRTTRYSWCSCPLEDDMKAGGEVVLNM